MPAMEPKDTLAERIVDTALDVAEGVGWDHVQLRVVAAEAGLDMAEIAVRFRDRDAIANAWFERARVSLLQPFEPGFYARPARERLATAFMRWFDALAAHRSVTVQMLSVKLWPFHPHHWVPMIFDLSRTVLWIRDAAGLDAAPPRREVEEVGLTWLFLGTLAVWARDGTPGQERTRRFLDRRLREADCVLSTLYRSGDAEPYPTSG